MAAVLLITMLDHASTLYGSYRVVTGSYAGIASVADWLRDNTPSDSIVIGNAIHTTDVRLYSKGHFTAFRTAGPSDPQAVSTPRELESLLAKDFDRRDVYLLDMDCEFPSDKSWYHSHRFVENKGIAKQDLGKIHVTRVRYPFFDPLRNLIDRPYITFLGPPDLENDFYHGRAETAASSITSCVSSTTCTKSRAGRCKTTGTRKAPPQWREKVSMASISCDSTRVTSRFHKAGPNLTCVRSCVDDMPTVLSATI